MQPLLIVISKVSVDADAGLARRPEFFWVDILVFHSPPETLDEDVVVGPSPVVHADLASRFLEKPCVLGAGEMAALVAVHDFRHSAAERFSARLQDKINFQRVIDGPGQHVARVPVDDGGQVKP